jgi:hypothetical protein
MTSTAAAERVPADNSADRSDIIPSVSTTSSTTHYTNKPHLEPTAALQAKDLAAAEFAREEARKCGDLGCLPKQKPRSSVEVSEALRLAVNAESACHAQSPRHRD